MSATKRMRPTPSVNDEDMAFSVCFEQMTSLKQLIDIVGSVLPRAFITLKRHSEDEKTVVLSIDTIDSQHVCIVQARLVCSGKIDEEVGTSICVDTSTMSKCLRNLPPHHAVQLQAKRGSADVILRSFDALNDSEDITFELHTLDEDCEQIPLDDMQYEFETDMDLPNLKRMIKLADALKCETVRMSLSSYTDDDGTVHASTEFLGKGEALFKRAFTSSATRGAGSLTVEDMDHKKLKHQFGANFSLDYLNKFVKAMEHQLVNIKFGTDDSGGDLPLTIKYPLGVPDSFVRFVLAPKTEDA